MPIRPCLRQKPPVAFKTTCHNCRKYTSRPINPSIPSQQEEATQRPTIPPKWPTRQPAADPSAVPETTSSAPLRELISILTTKSATKRNERMTISAFTPTNAKRFYPQGPGFKRPMGTSWDRDSRAWRQHVPIPRWKTRMRQFMWSKYAKPKRRA
jgi:hypothetical protein